MQFNVIAVDEFRLCHDCQGAHVGACSHSYDQATLYSTWLIPLPGTASVTTAAVLDAGSCDFAVAPNCPLSATT